jgi:hypothetical protein
VIDKNVETPTRIADRHYPIERGRVVWSRASAALAAAPEVQHRHLKVWGAPAGPRVDGGLAMPRQVFDIATGPIVNPAERLSVR